jgi:protein gp37
MLGRIDISRYLASGVFDQVTCGGESGQAARICDYSWILDTRAQCERYGTAFYFKQTGALFRKDGRLFRIPRKLQMLQARKAGIDLPPRV